MSVLYNDKELQEALKEWQHILKLDACVSAGRKTPLSVGRN